MALLSEPDADVTQTADAVRFKIVNDMETVKNDALIMALLLYRVLWESLFFASPADQDGTFRMSKDIS
jgi:hypothetical protein